jgi:hypothetical protein
MIAKTDIVRLKITLDDVEPKVTRQLVVPLGIRLDRLHAVIQVAVGWTNTHLWEFRARGCGWGLPDPDWADGPLDARKATLYDVVEDTGAKTLKYLYDFGDGWEHTVKLEKVFEAGPADRAACPMLLAASGRCPPEDVGGPSGYAEFLEAINDRQHERHAEMTQWYGNDFDPTIVQTDYINEAFAKLAKRWAPRPRRTVKRKPK